MEASLPIYGLACPDTQQAQEEFDTKKNCGCTMNTTAQQLISGIIINGSTRKPFEAGLVNVYNTQTKKGTTPDANGAFQLYASPTDVIHISFVGYDTLQIAASKLPATITLQESSELLSEVVITANKKGDNNYIYASMGLLGLLFIYAIAKDKKKNKTTT
jgi:hypothetical protein